MIDSSKRSSGAFRPSTDDQDFFDSLGERKQPLQARSTMALWPRTREHQEQLFWSWHAIVMQLCRRHGYSLRVPAVIKKFVFWQDGRVRATNEMIAAAATRCSEKTILRDLQLLEGIGVIKATMVFDPETKKTSRVIDLTFPKEVENVVLPDE
ncbi:MAG: hypothetical protein E5X80_04900 [Mesorhizobium sp.]|uniref:hypothetical protein n=1 Tax=Mesorhizobium sp. TaxID=1871066 RepID=UPI0012031212|nr:hypothetical protein [Mesorhizobium sp.]TIO52995.1 MAG: hypothetical protein E5X78_10145 [Mesorhizobium sp.]TIO61828.1 MAG: hypothetical protein E5X79_05525 [Mesorhizobium sp.]TJV66717.1 MAG: hypothetical protein E5X80_04900 [Mesorhizobium sp.]